MLFNYEWGVFCKRAIVDNKTGCPSTIDILPIIKAQIPISLNSSKTESNFVNLGALNAVFLFTATDELIEKLRNSENGFSDKITLSFKPPVPEQFKQEFDVKFGKDGNFSVVVVDFHHLPCTIDFSNLEIQRSSFTIEIFYREEFVSSISLPIEIKVEGGSKENE